MVVAVDLFAAIADVFEREAERADQATRYLYDPVGFARDCIDWRGPGLAPYQEDVLAAIPQAHRLAVRAGRGAGKTTANAVAVLWFALTRDAATIDWKVVTTASVERQLRHYLWPEIHKWAGRIRWDVLGRPPFRKGTELLDMTLKLDHGEAFAAVAADPAKIEGAHADSLLFIADEAKAIPTPIFDALEGALSGGKGGQGALPEAFALAFSTPGEPSGRFYDIFARKPGLTDWSALHITHQQTVAAGRVDAEWSRQRALHWGPDSALYHNHVLGEFHSSDEDVVIPLSWVEAAVERWHAWNDAGRPQQVGRRVFGVDVARGGRDLTVIAERQGDIVVDLTELNVADTTAVTSAVRRKMIYQQDMAIVDVIGVGAGVFDQLHRERVSVSAFNAAARSEHLDRTRELGMLNARAALWWLMREALDPAFDPAIALPPNDDLIGELVAPKWDLTAGSKIKVESKDDIRLRLGRSTDRADAVLMSLWPVAVPTATAVASAPWGGDSDYSAPWEAISA